MSRERSKNIWNREIQIKALPGHTANAVILSTTPSSPLLWGIYPELPLRKKVIEKAKQRIQNET